MLMKQLVFHFNLFQRGGGNSAFPAFLFLFQFSFQQLLSLPRYPMMIALYMCMLKEIRYPQCAHVQNVSFGVNYNQGWGKQCFELLNDFLFYLFIFFQTSCLLLFTSPCSPESLTIPDIHRMQTPRFHALCLLSVTQSCLICL